MGPLFGVSCIESTMFFGSSMAKRVCVHKMLQHFCSFFLRPSLVNVSTCSLPSILA
jgi:hypothetical protein